MGGSADSGWVMAENWLFGDACAKGLGLGVERSKSDEEGKTGNLSGEINKSRARAWFS